MARSLVLVVSAHPQRLQDHHTVIQAAGHWLTVPAPTLDRALTLLDTLRPALVVYDAADADGLAQPLHQALHGCALHGDTHLLLLGNLAPEQHPGTNGAACPHCASCPHCAQVYPTTQGAELVALLAHVLADTDEGGKYPLPDAHVDGMHGVERASRDGRDRRWMH
jgi:hypothetical protein